VSVIADNCAAIKYLEICSSPDLTDASMLLLAQSCLQLESFTYLQPLPANYQFGSATFMRFVETCPSLISLNLSNNCLTDAIVCLIAQSCPGLFKFNISNNNALTDAYLISLANKCKQLVLLQITYNEKLKHDSLLSMAEKILNSDRSKTNFADLRSILESCENLQSLTLDEDSTRIYRNKLRLCFPNISFTPRVDLFLDNPWSNVPEEEFILI
jgi:hypothetical protein